MRDFNLNDSAPGEETAESNAIISQLHGGGGEDSGEFDLTMASAPKKSLPLQAIAVGLVLVVGAGSLYLMRRHGTRAGLDFSATMVVKAEDTTLDRIENEEEILAALRTAPPEQVPREQVPGSVFKINKLTSSDTGSVVEMDPGKAAAERRRVEIERALAKLQVESVMHGRVPIAKISGKLFRVGDAVGDLFVVERIEDRSVFLEADGKEFELSMIN